MQLNLSHTASFVNEADGSKPENLAPVLDIRFNSML